jgi:ribosomal protein S18 acetylase RimI-like enzyme
MAKIVPVSFSDLSDLLRIAEFTFRSAWQQLNDPHHFEKYCRDNFTMERILLEYEDANNRFFFLVEDEVRVGYFKLILDCKPPDYVDATGLQIARLYLVPEAQCRGIGGKVLAFATELAHEKLVGCIWLSVWKRAPQSIRFYQKNGFEIFGEEIFWVGDDPQIDWLMWKRVIPMS